MEDLAAKILDRVKIMRVFDVVGVMEAIGEVKDELEGRTRKSEIKEEEVKQKDVVEVPKKAQRTVIADSEDEEDDDEMLFDIAEGASIKPTASAPPLSPSHPSDAKPEPLEEGDAGKGPRVSFILIDNLAHVLSPLLKKDYVQGTPILKMEF